MQSFVKELHWHKLIFSFEEKVLYYWEPYGSRLRASSPFMTAFETHVASLGQGWRFVSIEVKFQTDGWNCGVWTTVADQAFIAYTDSTSFGTSTFASFLIAWGGRMGRGIIDLNTVRGSGSGRRAAVEGNVRFINQERDRLRDLLSAAAREGKLAWDDGPRHDDFVEGTSKERSNDLAASINLLDDTSGEEDGR